MNQELTVTKKITLSKIAEHCGVSRAVVSAIVNNRENDGKVRFSEDTRQRVLTCVHETGYRRNRTVKNYYQRQHNSIGLITGTLYNVHEQTMHSIFSQCKKHKQLLNIERFYSDKNEMPSFVTEDCVDGILIFDSPAEEIITEIKRLHIPCVFVNSNYRNKDNCVDFDEQGGMEKVVACLQGLSCRRFISLFANRSHFSSAEREQALHELSQDRSLSYQNYDYNLDYFDYFLTTQWGWDDVI